MFNLSLTSLLNRSANGQSLRAKQSTPLNLTTRASIGVAVALTILASPVRGQCPPFAYDFNTLANGDVISQDGWVAIPGWGHPLVIAGGGPDGSKALGGNSSGFASGAARRLPHPFAYTTSNRSAVWSFKGKYAVAQNNTACISVVGFDSAAAETDPQIFFGMNFDSTTQGTPKVSLGGSGFSRIGETVTVGHWYEFQLTIDFGVAGGSGTLRYRDITAGQTGFTTNANVTDVPLRLPTTTGSYVAYWMEFRIDNVPAGTLVDDFSMDDPSIVAASISQEPAPFSACAGGSVTFAVAASGAPTPTYRWRKNTIPIDTTANPSAATAALSLTNISAADVASYDCVVTNSCGSVISNPATLSICYADFTCDGQVDDADFVSFAAAYDLLICEDPNMPAGCPSDLNGDDLVDDADFVIFANAYNALLCS